MRDHRRVRDPRVGPALLRRHLRLAQGQAAHVRLVDHRLVVRDLRRPVVAPVEERVDHHVLRHPRRAVLRVPPLAGRCTGSRTAPRPTPCPLRPPCRTDRAAAWRRAARPRRGPRPAHPVPVSLPGPDPGQVAVPDEPVDLGEGDPGFGPAPVPPTIAGSSNRHSSTPSATSENRAKLLPRPSHAAPSGYGAPGQMCIPLLARSVCPLSRCMSLPRKVMRGAAHAP